MRLITFITAGAFTVCSAFIMKKENKQPVTPLYKTKWSLKKIYSIEKEHVVAGNAFIRFAEEKHSAGGNGGCNNFGGSFIIINNRHISITNIISTKMYCEGIQPIEDLYLAQLGKINRYEIKNKKLLLYLDKDVLLEFKAE